jgi:transcriptional regulator with XRE-family HTH domain
VTGDRDTLKALGLRIRNARKDAGLTLRQMAGKARVGESSLNMWECGYRDPGVGGLNAVARALGLTAAELLGERETPAESIASLMSGGDGSE